MPIEIFFPQDAPPGWVEQIQRIAQSLQEESLRCAQLTDKLRDQQGAHKRALDAEQRARAAVERRAEKAEGALARSRTLNNAMQQRLKRMEDRRAEDAAQTAREATKRLEQRLAQAQAELAVARKTNGEDARYKELYERARIAVAHRNIELDSLRRQLVQLGLEYEILAQKTRREEAEAEPPGDYGLDLEPKVEGEIDGYEKAATDRLREQIGTRRE